MPAVHTDWVIAAVLALILALPSCTQADDGLIPIQLPGGVIIQAEIASTMKKRAEIDVPRTFGKRPRHAVYLRSSAALDFLDEKYKNSARYHLDE
jgi:hypothetical protein